MTIKRKEVAAHRQWMIRSYALTLAAVTLRLQLGVYQGVMGMEFLEAYAIVGWSCWVPNILVVEWWLRYREDRIKL